MKWIFQPLQNNLFLSTLFFIVIGEIESFIKRGRIYFSHKFGLGNYKTDMETFVNIKKKLHISAANLNFPLLFTINHLDLEVIFYLQKKLL